MADGADKDGSTDSLLVIVLAAGQGTRMRSLLPKVLHPIAGLSMLGHVLATAAEAGAEHTVLVTSPNQDDVRAAAGQLVPSIGDAIQHDQLGTAHAVLAARVALEEHEGPVLVLYGDTPLVTVETLQSAVEAVRGGDRVVVVGFEEDDPTGYGRLICDNAGHLLEIVEHADATDAQRQVTLCNSGIVCFGGGAALSLLERVGNDNAKGEYYLTDVVGIVRQDGGTAGVVRASSSEVLGVNSRAQLADAEAIFQQRRRRAVMESGVTMIAPESVMLSYDTEIGQDVVVEPNVFFGPGVKISPGAHIRAFSHLEGASVESGAVIGPYARLRPGAKLGPDTKVGNFVEVKAASVEAGAKINHLSYVGDARVGENANIGAGTITCNYDGFNKSKTDIGAGAFIGSNSALVAPVKIGDGAYVGSGSVISKNVTDDALALTRAPQVEKSGWAEKFRIMMSRRKEKRAAS